jgi:hypothetical protein
MAAVAVVVAAAALFFENKKCMSTQRELLCWLLQRARMLPRSCILGNSPTVYYFHCLFILANTHRVAPRTHNARKAAALSAKHTTKPLLGTHSLEH